MAEFAFSSVLDVFQPNPARRASQQARAWQGHEFREVCGSQWLIVGLGRVGSEIATRARAFGARVLGVRRSPRGDEPVDRILAPDAIFSVLPETDVIVLSAALNASTQSLVDAQFLACLKPDAVLVNVARGGIVDEAALLQGLDDARPAAAILDVFETEPLPEDSRLWLHPRVRLSAHCSAESAGTGVRGDALFLENLGRYLAGEPLCLEVDPAVFREPERD